jgi:hypothetical protein
MLNVVVFVAHSGRPAAFRARLPLLHEPAPPAQSAESASPLVGERQSKSRPLPARARDNGYQV